MQALAFASLYAEHRMREQGRVPIFSDIDVEKIRKQCLPGMGVRAEGKWLNADISARLFRAFGIRAAETQGAMSAEKAADVAD